jgi:hypothetical protein
VKQRQNLISDGELHGSLYNEKTLSTSLSDDLKHDKTCGGFNMGVTMSPTVAFRRLYMLDVCGSIGGDGGVCACNIHAP